MSIFVVIVGPALDLDRPPHADVPVGLERVALAPAHPHLDDALAADLAEPVDRDAGDGVLGQRPRAEVELLGRLGVLGLAHDLVEHDPEGIAHQGDRFAEDHRRRRGHARELGVVERASEADGDLGGRRVVGRGVGLLADQHVVDAVRGVGQRDGDELDVARADAAAEHRAAALRAGVEDPLAPVVGVRLAVDEGRRGDDVDAGLEDADHLVHVEPHRVVDDAVGLEGEQRVDVVRGREPDRRQSAQLTDVLAGLVLRPGVATDQLEVRALQHRLDRLPADVARRPLHDTNRHCSPSIAASGDQGDTVSFLFERSLRPSGGSSPAEPPPAGVRSRSQVSVARSSRISKRSPDTGGADSGRRRRWRHSTAVPSLARPST